MINLLRVKRILYSLHWQVMGNKQCCVISTMLDHTYFLKKITLSPHAFQFCSQISTFPILFKFHTTKGWKAMAVAEKRLKKKVPSEVQSPAACEEGKGAVLHSTLITELEKCNSVSSQIDHFCSLMSLSEEEIERRTLFCQSLEEMFKMYFTDFKLHQFGSSVNGLGFKGCDMDVCLQTLYHNEDYVMLKDVPAIDSVAQGTLSQETLARMTPMYMLRFVRRIFRHHSTDIKEPILFIKARCPLLRFYNAKYDVFCDFTCESANSLQNTKLTRLMCHLDERFMKLAKVIRYWGKYGGFVGDIDMFNSYSFSLLIIYFLQNTNPPVLPSIQEILYKSSYLKDGDVSNVKQIMEDLKNFEPSKNSTTVDNLLREFYFYYLNFDFERVLQPLTSDSVHKTNFPSDLKQDFVFGTVSIQDPFSKSFNCTGSVTYRNCFKFLSGLIQACEVYQNNEWTQGGVCSLFKPPVQDSTLSKERQQNRLHHFSLTAKPEAALKLRKILEHGLLFHCKEFIMDLKDLEDDTSKVILKLQCKAYHNTWQGRDWVLQKYNESQHEPLTMENSISKDLVQSKVDYKKEVLCEFICVCRESKSQNQEPLLVSLDFKGTKFPYIVSIFLKEFIPHVYNKL